MFRNYFKISIRSMMKNKMFSFLNLLGLSIGLSVFILVGIYAYEEYKIDRFNEHYDTIYRMEYERWFHTPAPLIPLLKEHMPSLEAVSPTENRSINYIENGEKKTLRKVKFVTADFLNIFTIKTISGDLNKVLTEPAYIALSQSLANSLFGDENPIGKQFKMKTENYTFTVGAIFKDFEDQSHLFCEALTRFINLEQTFYKENLYDNWDQWNFQTYIRISENADITTTIETFNKNLNDFMRLQSGEDNDMFLSARHLFDVYFMGNMHKSDNNKHGNLQYLFIFTTMAILTILIAIINFVNIATARAGIRGKEVGIRKVHGANRKDIFSQFIGEAFLLTIIAVIFAFLMAELALPSFNHILGRELSLSILVQPSLILAMVGFIILVGFFTGIYPAYFMASFNLISILKKENVKGKKGLQTRRLFLLFQFIITISLLLFTFAVHHQLNYMRNKDLGFDSDQIIFFGVPMEVLSDIDNFKAKLNAHDTIERTSLHHSTPGNYRMEWGRVLSDVGQVNFFCAPCDENYIPLFDLELVEGRNFDPNLASDKNAFIVNEAFVKANQLENPLEYKFGDDLIIGVVKDFSFQSLHNEIQPMALHYMHDWSSFLAVKTKGRNIEEVVKIIKKECSQYTENKIWIQFVDELLEKQYRKDKIFGKIFSIMSSMAIMVTCLGLLGLIAFESSRRKKEIGVRKVLGASVWQIIHMFNKELFIMLFIASIISWFSGYFILTKWLQNFAYRSEINIFLFLLASLVTLMIAMLTFTFYTYKTANENPVVALKYE
jgi:putative ABC transport system permease protein